MENLKYDPLTDTDIKAKLGGKTKVMTYAELSEYEDIDSLLAPYGNVVFLLRQGENFGHWLCLKRIGDRISFFDSYGEFPDKQKQHVDREFSYRSGEKINKLCELLYKASFKYTIEFSEFKYQKKDNKTATCGHWCCLFILSGLRTDDFHKFISKFNEKDKDLLCIKLYFSKMF